MAYIINLNLAILTDSKQSENDPRCGDMNETQFSKVNVMKVSSFNFHWWKTKTKKFPFNELNQEQIIYAIVFASSKSKMYLYCNVM